MDYAAACNFLQCENKIYNDEEIKTIYRKGLLFYHPDKRLNVPKTVADDDFHKFTTAIDQLKAPKNNVIHSVIILEEYNALINEITKKMNKIKKNTPIISPQQIINYPVSAFELFSTKEFTHNIKIAYEGELKKISLRTTPTPMDLTKVFLSMGHKNYDEQQGNIIVTAVPYNSESEAYSYDEQRRILYIAIKIKKSMYGKIVDLILPCKKIIKSILPVDPKEPVILCGQHYKYPLVTILGKIVK